MIGWLRERGHIQYGLVLTTSSTTILALEPNAWDFAQPKFTDPAGWALG